MTPIAIAVVEHAGCYLIGQRPEGKPLAGLWEFPGGKVEAGETAEEAAVRECREETGIAVEVVGEYPLQEFRYAHDEVQLRFFRCRVAAGAMETPGWPFIWGTRKALAEFEFPPGNEAILAVLLREND
jgi:8-oxo-dGTP diphosphatase